MVKTEALSDLQLLQGYPSLFFFCTGSSSSIYLLEMDIYVETSSIKKSK